MIVSTCRSILALLAAIASVITVGFKVDMTVMAALSSVIIFSFMNLNDYTDGDMDKSEKWTYKFWQQLGKKSPFFRRLYGDWRALDKSRVELFSEIKTIDIKDKKEAVRYIEDNLSNGILFRGDKINADTNFKIVIARKVYEDTLTYANREYSRTKSFDEYLARLSILLKIVDVVEKSILLDTQTIGNDKNIYRSFIHKFYNIVKIEDKEYIAKLAVDELDIEGNEIKRAYNVGNIKISPIAVSRFFNSADTMGDGGSTASNFTVADLHALVKKYDKDFRPLSFHERKKNSALTAFTILLTLIIALYVPIRFRNLVLPCCITLASGFFVSAVCRCFVKESSTAKAGLPVWSFSPILLFAIFFFSFSPLSPIVSDLTFSMEYESGTSFPFIRKSALDVEASLLEWNSFSRLTLHIDQGRAAFTVLGGRRREIMSKIAELSDLYPEIFFYIPEKHTRHAIDVTVYGNDVTEIENNILQLAKYVSKSADNVNIIYNFKSDVTNIVLEIPVKCASSGLYPYDVYKALYYTAAEPVVDKFFAGDVETDIKIRGTGRYRKTLSGLLSVPILSPFGIAGEAGDYITVRKEQAQGRIYHRNRMRVLSFSVTGISRSDLRRIVSTFPFTGNCHGEVL